MYITNLSNNLSLFRWIKIHMLFKLYESFLYFSSSLLLFFLKKILFYQTTIFFFFSFHFSNPLMHFHFLIFTFTHKK